MPGEFRDLAEPVRLPGCVPIPGVDILSPLQDKSSPSYRWMVHHGARYREAHAILVNSFDVLEPDAARRTKDAGLLVPSWAPQTEVLAHEATGCFLVHCGWNSVLESLAHGVPMVAWPLFAEQRQNAVMLSEGVGAAVRVPATKRKEEIAAAVREVMAGQAKGAEVRAKVATLQKAAIEGLLEGGAATAALDEVANKWTGAEHA
ncbi:unnamed protein product [Triticum turgidum subsp. durum]|uniref:Glycosyltransferase n=1 Tax=Triticum turgidum subsp. durum TaxID=4567 RepID=A0A9R1RWX4_TRITD|nr:unnamed protein product [Triticum turgidum subsp. durum]